ncbi:hypothetical protein [Bradyrhizobium sp.]|uniref:hypothetical protein n=1 Tax=Bradyrhizobium sp. TaxID=376 RepID=UPI003C78D4D1
MAIAILIATVVWFVAAFALFFNPVVDKIYSSQEGHPSVRALPKSPPTIVKILAAIVVQCTLWAIVFTWIKAALPVDLVSRGVLFGTILSFTKLIPRDIDRMLLTTYPAKRLTIEFVIGVVCAYIVAFVFAYRMP